jgi:hypothetical protein
MKKLIVVLLVLLFSSSCLAADIQFLPSFTQVFNRYKDSNKLKLIAGALSSIVVHELSHIAMLEINDVDYNISWEGMSGHGKRDYQSDMAGFVGQNIIGFILPRKSDFALGYNTCTFLATITYPLRIDNGDFGQNGRMLEWGIASLAASVNIIQVTW